MNISHSESTASSTKLAILLLVSGACALIFQVVWIRELRLIFGATTLASSAVLAIFMGGLGLGNAVLGKRIDQLKRPVRFYAWLEIGIACLAAVSPFLIDITKFVYVGIGGQSVMGVEFATIVRLVASTAILVGPTFLMGGTLPAAACAVTSTDDSNRKNLARIYAFNTLGAVIGAGLANFLLLEALGNRALLWSACLVNSLLAFAAFRYSKSLSTTSCQQPMVTHRKHAAESSVVDATARRSARLALLYGSSAVVGFVFFQMEIVWYRMLGPLLGGTTYTLGLILCIALLGIGIGGWLYNISGNRIAPTFRLLIATCTLEALFLSLPFWYGDQIAMWVLRQQLDGIPSFAAQIWNWFQVGAVVILPASIVSGFQFPVLIGLAGTGQRDVGKHVGWTFAANTVGAICGSILGGFFLLPMLGALGLWQTSVTLLVTLGAVIAVISNRSISSTSTTSQIALYFSAGCAILAIAGIAGEGPSAAWRHSGIGAGRADTEGRGRNAEQQFINTKRRQLVWEAEGVESSIGITATDSLAFVVNGKSDGNAYSDAGTQIGLGLLGPLLKPEAKSGLVIGLGTGESAGWLADSITDSVDIVELESTILTMAERCGPMNRQVLQNPRVRIHYNDAREFLLTSKSVYDVIISEPSNPYRAGIANLYTQEFYQSAIEKLSDDGLFLQWLQGYEVDDQTVRMVLKTLQSVFPHVEVWRTKARDMVLVCGKSSRSLSYDPASVANMLSHPVIKEGVRKAWQTEDAAGVLAHYVCGQTTIDVFLGDQEVMVNTDNRNLLEYAFAKSVGKVSKFSIQDLQALAVSKNDSPLRSPAPMMAKLLPRRRLAMHLHLGGAMPSTENSSEGEIAIATAYQAYLGQDYSQSLNVLQRLGIDDHCPIEFIVYAHSSAEVGSILPESILEKLRRDMPTEHAAITAIYELNKGNRVQGTEALLLTLELMKSNPWGNEQLYKAVLQKAIETSTSDTQTAESFFHALKDPLAMYRLEDMRLLARYLVSENLDAEKIAESLAAFEPNVPWKRWFLEKRCETYRELQHRLLNKAESDLEKFLSWERATQ